MPNKLYNILVPVDFTGKTKWAISKAVELANTFHCNIHLVHTLYKPILPLVPVDKSILTPFESHIDLQTAREKLAMLKAAYKSHLCGEGNIEISVLQGNPRKELKKYIEQYDMDLVVIGLAKFNLVHRIVSSISISRLARSVNVPVLAVRASGLVSHFKKIVLPLHGEIPLQRIKLATMLARSFRSTVYLVSLRSQVKSAETNLLDSALEIIQSLSTIPVQCFLLEGQNIAKSTLEFSKRINADLIVDTPDKDFRLPGIWNRVTNKILSYGSRIPVLSIDQPGQKKEEKQELVAAAPAEA